MGFVHLFLSAGDSYLGRSMVSKHYAVDDELNFEGKKYVVTELFYVQNAGSYRLYLTERN